MNIFLDKKNYSHLYLDRVVFILSQYHLSHDVITGRGHYHYNIISPCRPCVLRNIVLDNKFRWSGCYVGMLEIIKMIIFPK